MTLLYVAVGGAIGASARYMVSIGSGRIFGLDFPYGTLLVNVAGSLLMGVLAGVLARTLPEHQHEMRAFIGVGILGGFTTFSAFSLDAWLLLEQGRVSAGAGYIAASVILSIMALIGGLMLVRLWP